ncbi:sulfite exporter TauE/SafE family protein 2 isoform X2 [Arachis hypogaea]|uniref:sulfite exporter TauE/SafE family protein 2 isoform X2 n=1 Tax=Arachis hypogaea TaxID=3818 RepID=UPI000DEC89EA|nr:sulfite exporter TauE/SafE family protein 2 isoform X2 [Arachis hypogaea]
MNHASLSCFLLIFIVAFNSAKSQTSSVEKIYDDNGSQEHAKVPLSGHMLLASLLCFVASSISSAGGIGGGGLFIPILTIVASLDLKTASSLSAFMVTGGSIANVFCNLLCTTSTRFGGKSLIDYDIALLSEPCMLLGVSIGVICNLVFPEWLITLLFAIFLTWCTSKTCINGVLLWKAESEEIRKKGFEGVENGDNAADEEGQRLVQENKQEIEEGLKSLEPLLAAEENRKFGIPWLKVGVLLLVWFCFFFLYLLRGNKYGQSIIPMEACGVGFWILSSVQVPLAIVFTAWIVLRKEGPCLSRSGQPNKMIFPVMALLAGMLGGVFGIGGGMLISPLLIQVTAATCSFMVFFSSTMSALQYVMLGMEYIETAVTLAIICFIASLLGLLVLHRAIKEYGRPSLIVFSVSLVMTLSNVLMTSFGAMDIWKDYKSGKYMGFNQPC